ncbi:MAG: DnaJ domain-containing protein [Bdellovibrionales bacterium]|nr:DnaJ domain-containing protein [Bdellovibrionales bacterium]
MKDYYKILGVVNSATPDEIRRAYRVLARRYHPDVNPDDEHNERFKDIAEAYAVLKEDKSRSSYDIRFESYQRRQMHEKFRAYHEQQKTAQGASFQTHQRRADTFQAPPSADEPNSDTANAIQSLKSKFTSVKHWCIDKWFEITEPTDKPPPRSKVVKVSLVEISLSVEDAICGIRKTVEIHEPEGTRKVSVAIPSGVRDGSVLRLRNKENPSEDLVLIIRLASHSFLSLKQKGLVVEVPITVNEAISGSQITVPGLEDEMIIRVPPGSQSGDEIQVSEAGVVGKGGHTGDLFFRLLVKVPEHPDAVGLKEKAAELDQYYGSSVRDSLPRILIQR